jgi:hypothetical protein
MGDISGRRRGHGEDAIYFVLDLVESGVVGS